jgi:hypothetical protein
MRIRAYTLDVHVGHAPCWMYDPARNCELLTLANCKPLIRDVASEGEWIAGVTPTRMGHRLAYLMRVGERITRFQYWERYKDSRLDSIYRPKANGGWKQLKNPWHFNEESFTRDLSSDWVLLSRDFYVFANSYSGSETNPRGLVLPDEYSELARGGMRGYGHFIDLPDTFLPSIQKLARLELADFRVLRDFGDDGCGCCQDEVVSSETCQ